MSISPDNGLAPNWEPSKPWTEEALHILDSVSMEQVARNWLNSPRLGCFSIETLARMFTSPEDIEHETMIAGGYPGELTAKYVFNNKKLSTTLWAAVQEAQDALSLRKATSNPFN
jgi:hypothetical protein